MIRGIGNLQSNIAFRFPHQSITNHSRGHLVTFAARQRRVVYRERHCQGRRIDGFSGERFTHLQVAQSIRDCRLSKTGNGNDIARRNALDRHTLQAAKRQQLCYAGSFQLSPITRERLNSRIGFQTPGLNASGQHPAEMGVGVEHGGQQTEVTILLDARRRHIVDDQIK